MFKGLYKLYLEVGASGCLRDEGWAEETEHERDMSWRRIFWEAVSVAARRTTNWLADAEERRCTHVGTNTHAHTDTHTNTYKHICRLYIK